jgi:hypothetical protein
MKVALIAIAIAVGGIVFGSIAAGITRKWLEKRPQEALRDAAKGVGGLVMGLFCAAGLVGALGVASPESLKPLPADFARFIPQAVVAALLMIGGRIVAQLVGVTVGKALLKASGKQPQAILKTVEFTILTLVGLLAARQLGIDTTVLNIMLSAVAFGAALAMALLIGIGGRDVAREIAAGRVLAKLLQVDDVIQYGAIHGAVAELHPTVIVIQTPEGLVSLGNTALQSGPLKISRKNRDESA